MSSNANKNNTRQQLNNMAIVTIWETPRQINDELPAEDFRREFIVYLTGCLSDRCNCHVVKLLPGIFCLHSSHDVTINMVLMVLMGRAIPALS
jgi:hypothetical protein